MSKRKLLLADDSITIQKVVNLTFADEGIEVIAVGDGDAAMQKFVEVMPDLVMADVNMPGVDGYHICEMIKQDDDTKNIPVILLVGSFEPFDEEEARRVGADDYLTKPFQSIRQLVNKVTDLLDNSDSSAESPMVEEPTHFESDEVDEYYLPDKPGETGIPIYMENSVAQLGDAGMDDEMIQTDQLNVLPIYESQNFESQPLETSEFESSIAAPTFGNVQPTSFEDSYQSDLESSAGYNLEQDFAKTQPLTTQDFNEIRSSDEEDATSSREKAFEIVNEDHNLEPEIQYENNIEEPEIIDNQPDFEPEEITEQQFSEPSIINEFESESANESENLSVDESEKSYFYKNDYDSTEEVSETVPLPEVASVLDLDEMNLLELPTSEKSSVSNFEYVPVEKEESALVVEELPQEIEESPQELTETTQIEARETSELISLSPESIEAIAERVADLIIQKLATQPSED